MQFAKKSVLNKGVLCRWIFLCERRVSRRDMLWLHFVYTLKCTRLRCQQLTIPKYCREQCFDMADSRHLKCKHLRVSTKCKRSITLSISSE